MPRVHVHANVYMPPRVTPLSHLSPIAVCTVARWRVTDVFEMKARDIPSQPSTPDEHALITKVAPRIFDYERSGEGPRADGSAADSIETDQPTNHRASPWSSGDDRTSFGSSGLKVVA